MFMKLECLIVMILEALEAELLSREGYAPNKLYSLLTSYSQISPILIIQDNSMFLIDWNFHKTLNELVYTCQW